MKLERALSIMSARLLFSELLRQLAVFLAVSGSVAAAAAFFDYYWPFPELLRWGICCALFLFFLQRCVKLAGFFAGRKRLAAEYLDSHGGNGRVRGAFEFLYRRDEIPGSVELMDMEIEAVEKLPCVANLPKTGTRRILGRAVISCVCILVLLAAGRGKTGHQLKRILFPWRDLPAPALKRIVWLWPPKEHEVSYGESLDCEVLLRGTGYEPELMAYEGEKKRHKLSHLGQGRYFAELSPLKENVKLEVRAGPFASEAREVTVAPQKAISEIRVLCEFPAYTERAPKRLTLSSSRIEVLSGTRLTLFLRGVNANKGGYRFRTGGVVKFWGKLKKENGDLTCSFEASESGELELSTGSGNRQNRVITVDCVKDSAPEISVEFPPPELVACEGTVLPVRVEVRDNLGISSVRVSLPDRSETDYPEGKRFYTFGTEFEVPQRRGSPIRIEVTAKDNKQPEPNVKSVEPRVVKVLPRKAFEVLRRLEGFRILKRRLLRIREKTGKISGLCSSVRKNEDFSEAELKPLWLQLGELSGLVKELREDPVFAQEKKLSVPVLERASGLTGLYLPAIPKKESRVRVWLSQIRYFADELLTVLNKVFTRSRALASAQPFFRNLAEAMQLARKQGAVCKRIRKGQELSELLNNQRALKLEEERLSSRLGRDVPEGLAELSSKVQSILSGRELTSATDNAIEAMKREDREGSLKACRRATSLLEGIREAVASKGDYAEVDLLDLLSGIGKALDVKGDFSLGTESVTLWGPGVEEDRPGLKERAPLSGPLLLSVPRGARVVKERTDFYGPLVESFRRYVHKLKGKREEDGKR